MKILKYIGITLLISGALFATAYFIKTNDKSAIVYETKTIITTSIEKKTVITGKVIPEDEVEIKPQIQGIIDALFVEEGDKVNTGDLLAKIKVVPNEQNLNSAEGRLANSRIVLKNAKIDFKRNNDLLSPMQFLIFKLFAQVQKVGQLQLILIFELPFLVQF
jgi:HlyD family secretion protein